MNIWDLLFVQPLTNILLLFYTGLSSLHVSGSLGWSIVLLTIVVRGILWPFTKTQMVQMHKMQKLAPQLKQLKEQHGHDKKKHQEEQLRLYKEHGVNPATGCLLLIVQLPVLFALYGLLNLVFSATDPSALLVDLNQKLYFPLLHLTSPLDTMFFGVSLGARPSEYTTIGWWILLIPVVTGVLQLVQSKLMPQGVTSQKKEKKKDEKESTEEMMQGIQKQMMVVFPVMIGIAAYQFPIGLALYWNTFSLFGIIQQWQLRKLS